MTRDELIQELQRFPSDMPVYVNDAHNESALTELIFVHTATVEIEVGDNQTERRTVIYLTD